ncbi:hypothetical protein G6Z25_02015 [Clostridium perfringens]|uniref:hypothetical protein n=1 Tax=Clostridium perfringens TaxID=1502 RepID=UPI0013E3F37F|nr:hypothetical protein [Clostridium perfringens]NGS95694.1 hypothetical protein [Clostridium perfringens]
MLKVGDKVKLVNDMEIGYCYEPIPSGTEGIICRVSNEDKDFPYKIKICQFEFWVTERDITEIKKKSNHMNCNKSWNVKISKIVGLEKIRKIKNMCSLKYIEENSNYCMYKITRSLDICLSLIAELFKNFNIEINSDENNFLIEIC